MILWQKEIYDRNQADVDFAKSLLAKGWLNFTQSEKSEWLKGLKGTLNLSDLTRIQNNIQLISDVLEANLTVEPVPEYPKESFYETLLHNVDLIRNSKAGRYSTTPDVPQAPLNSFEKWNDIEKILLDVYTILNSNFGYYCASDNSALFAGSDIGLLE